MNPSLKQYFTFTRSQRSGIFILLFLMLLVQGIYIFVDSMPSAQEEDNEWMLVQSEIDSLKLAKLNFKPAIYPFNPNFITDFKGYKLGMSVEEIDRLLAFRKLDKFVNSAAEFQTVTKVSDSLLNAISPYFKFPEWVHNKKSGFANYNRNNAKAVVVKDINSATKEDLMEVYGIGPAISDRILKQREVFGGFVNMSQMNDVWGLSPEVIEKLNIEFRVNQLPVVKKIRINEASVKELAAFPYFRYALAKQIVTYRSMNGDIKSSADLVKINGFPAEKADLIALYLEF